ncbi:MAG: hypothetical protein AAFQ63_10625 [Cyanobacteria bacterium J06621_11]
MGEPEQRSHQQQSIKKPVKQRAKQTAKQPTTLNYQQGYSCPACGSGDLRAMAMMDVFACDFCRHMFTANLQTQSLQLADSLQPRAWQWTGYRWRAAHQRETKAALVWAFSLILTVAPVLLISVSNYIFPPSGGLKFVLSWVTLTGVTHGLISAWLLSEYHQWPWYVASRIRLQRMREQFMERAIG